MSEASHTAGKRGEFTNDVSHLTATCDRELHYITLHYITLHLLMWPK